MVLTWPFCTWTFTPAPVSARARGAVATGIRRTLDGAIIISYQGDGDLAGVLVEADDDAAVERHRGGATAASGVGQPAQPLQPDPGRASGVVAGVLHLTSGRQAPGGVTHRPRSLAAKVRGAMSSSTSLPMRQRPARS